MSESILIAAMATLVPAPAIPMVTFSRLVYVEGNTANDIWLMPGAVLVKVNVCTGECTPSV
jgi:hypothetical protein